MLDALFDLVRLACEVVLGRSDPMGDLMKAAEAQRQQQLMASGEDGD